MRQLHEREKWKLQKSEANILQLVFSRPASTSSSQMFFLPPPHIFLGSPLVEVLQPQTPPVLRHHVTPLLE